MSQGATILSDIGQHEAVLGPDGAVIIPAALRWRPGHRLLPEETDDRLLVSEVRSPAST